MEYNIYCDESGIRGCRYLAIGGFWLTRSSEQALRESLESVRQQHNLAREMKWTKVSTAMLEPYRAFVDVMLLDPAVRFKCIVIDTHLVDYNTFHQGDRDLCFYKFYYQLVSRTLNHSHLYWLYTDDRTTRQQEPLSTLRTTINAWCRKQGAPLDLLMAVEARKSKDDDLIQAADIVLGAVGASWNNEVTSTAKLDLMQHIAVRARLRSLEAATPIWNAKFNIWQWKPSRPKILGMKKRPIS